MAAPQLLIVYHTLTQGTLQMAQAACDGALAEGDVDVRLLHAQATQPSDVLAANAYVFATPENLAAMSGMMKDFFDRCYYPVLDRINGRAYASLVCAGSDGHGAARQIERIATGWRLKPVAEPSVPMHRRLKRYWPPSTFPIPICSAAANWAPHWRQAWRLAFSEPASMFSIAVCAHPSSATGSFRSDSQQAGADPEPTAQARGRAGRPDLAAHFPAVFLHVETCKHAITIACADGFTCCQALPGLDGTTGVDVFARTNTPTGIDM
ncbi:Flavodoxin [compost metagenome]